MIRIIRIITIFVLVVTFFFLGGILVSFFTHKPKQKEPEPEITKVIPIYEDGGPDCCEMYEEMKEIYYINLDHLDACKEELREYQKIDFGPLLETLKRTKQ